MDRFDPDLQRLHEPGKARGLARWQLEEHPPQGGRVDHRMLERTAEAPAEDPGVEGVMAVLDQDRAAGEVEERTPGVGELRRVDEHLALDQVPALGVGIDRRPGVDQGVEEAERATESEPLGADLEDQEWPVAGGLDVDRDELGLLQRRARADRREVVAPLDRLPCDEPGAASGLEPQAPVVRFSHGLPS